MMPFTFKSTTIFIAVAIQLMFAFLTFFLIRHYQIHTQGILDENGAYLKNIVGRITENQKDELDLLSFFSRIYPDIQVAYEEYYTINRSQLFSLDVYSKGDYKNEFEKYKNKILEMLAKEVEASEIYDLIFYDDLFQDQVITSHGSEFDRRNANRLNDLIAFAKKEREINSVFYYADPENEKNIYLCKIHDVPSIGAINPGFLIWRKLLCDQIKSFFPQDQHFKAFCSPFPLSDSGNNFVKYPIQNSQGNIGYILIYHTLRSFDTFFGFRILFVSLLFLICCYLFFYKFFIYPHDQLISTFKDDTEGSENFPFSHQNPFNTGAFSNKLASSLNNSIQTYKYIVRKLFVQASIIQNYKQSFYSLETWCIQYLGTIQKICDMNSSSLCALSREALEAKMKTVMKMSTWKPPVLEANMAEKHPSAIQSSFDLRYYIKTTLRTHRVRWYLMESHAIPEIAILDVQAFSNFWDFLLETDFSEIQCGHEGLVSIVYEENIGRIDIYLKLYASFSSGLTYSDLDHNINQCSHLITAIYFSKSFMEPLSWQIKGNYVIFKFGIEQKLSEVPPDTLASSLKSGLSPLNIMVISESPFLREVIDIYLKSCVNYIYFAENAVEAAYQINRSSISYHTLITQNTVGGIKAADFIPNFIIPSFVVIDGSDSDHFKDHVCRLDTIFSRKELINCLSCRPISTGMEFSLDNENVLVNLTPEPSNVSTIPVDSKFFHLIEAFTKDLEKNIQRMIDLIKLSETEEVRKIAHSLKGTSRSFNFLHKSETENFFDIIADIAAAIELSASNGSDNIPNLILRMKNISSSYRWISV